MYWWCLGVTTDDNTPDDNNDRGMWPLEQGLKWKCDLNENELVGDSVRRRKKKHHSNQDQVCSFSQSESKEGTGVTGNDWHSAV